MSKSRILNHALDNTAHWIDGVARDHFRRGSTCSILLGRFGAWIYSLADKEALLEDWRNEH